MWNTCSSKRTLLRNSKISLSYLVISPSILKDEVEEAVRSLTAGQSPGVDTINSELIKHGGEETTAALPEKMAGEEVAQRVDTVSGHPSTEKGQPQAV